MIVYLKTKSGKIVKESLTGTITLEEAESRFNNSLFTVRKVEEEIYGNWSNEKACQVIANEGADYAVRSYCSASEFKDPKTRELWTKASNAIDSLESYIGYSEWADENDC